MKKMINRETIEGKLFAHSLELKTVKSDGPNKGKPFIQGSVQIQVDEAGVNVVEVHYSYIPEFTKSGAKDRRFDVLTKIIETGKTVSVDGPDVATLVSATPAIALNDYYNIQTEEMGSYPVNEGGFLNIIQPTALKDEKERSKFETDAIITNVREVEVDEENGIEAHAVIKAGIFNFRNDFMPVEFKAYNQGAIDYFVGLEASASNPIFTKIAGNVRSATISRTITEESAFGEAAVRTVNRTIREYVITWAQDEPYEFDSEDMITKAELTKAIQDREVYLAEVKQRRLDYEKTRSNSNNAITDATPVASNDTTFNF